MEASEGPPEAADPGPTEPCAAPSIVRPTAAVIIALVSGPPSGRRRDAKRRGRRIGGYMCG